MRAEEFISEDLRKWFKEKWVRFGPDGKIRGDCARGSSKEGKPKCLPQSKAQALGKKGRASAAAKKRREDPNPERRGAAKNVATKVREEQIAEFIDVDAIHASALREHLLLNPSLFENREDFQQMQTFLNTHTTSTPKIDESYVYASVQTTPMLKYISLAHFADQHQLVKIDDQYAYFDINGSVKRFPESGTLAGDSLSKIYFFTTSKELQHFNTLMQLKFLDYKFTKKVLDQKLDELQFLGSECTKDCSGHRAGYNWSKAQGGVDGMSPWSPSFNKGAALAKAGK